MLKRATILSELRNIEKAIKYIKWNPDDESKEKLQRLHASRKTLEWVTKDYVVSAPVRRIFNSWSGFDTQVRCIVGIENRRSK